MPAHDQSSYDIFGSLDTGNIRKEECLMNYLQVFCETQSPTQEDR